MISFAEIAVRSRRHNHEENVWVNPFSGRVAWLFTWLFINLGLSANQVTALSFAAGVTSALVLLGDSLPLAASAFVLFRLHQIFDVSDGEVARYRGQVSRLGVFWDQLMHAMVCPLVLACLVLGRLNGGAELALVAFAMAGVIGKTTDLAVKNAYYRVLYAEGSEESREGTLQDAPRPSGKLRLLLVSILHLAGFEALLFFYTLAYLSDVSWLGLLLRDWVVAAYSIDFVLFALTRMVLTARHDRVPMRRDLRG